MATTVGAPVLSGNAHVTQLQLRELRVATVRFPPGLYLPSHYHDTACLTIMLDGTMTERIERSSVECPRNHVLRKPWGERHDDTFGSTGSCQIIIEVPTTFGDDLPEVNRIFAGVSVEYDPYSATIAQRMAREMRRHDATSGLAVEALALELMVGLLRRSDAGERRPPSWLIRARDRVHAELWSEHTTRDLAAEADVHPGYFAQQFRRHFGKSIGGYVRHARLEWAAAELRHSGRTLSELAHAARFADHSHFTREFKRQFGVPPKVYRQRFA